MTGHVKIRPPRTHCTPRRAELLTLIAAGYNTQETTKILGVSVNTMNSTLQELSDKWGCRGRAHLVAVAHAYDHIDVNRVVLKSRARTRCTPLQRDMVALFAAGATRPQIAAALWVDVSTTTLHMRRLRAKWSCTGRAHLVAAAIRHGHITLEGDSIQ